jgi:DGQHR domain-containing protein
MPTLRVQAVEFRQKDNRIYLFYIPANSLEKLVEQDPKLSTNPEGIQRLLSKTRLKDIAIYISRHETCFPNNIIVSLTKDVKFESQSNNGIGELVFPNDQGHFGDILDGQHRLYGTVYSESEVKDLLLPVTGLMLSNRESASRIFADINSLQKPVSKLLLVSLQKELGDLIDAKGSAAAIAEQLNEDDTSPLKDKIKMFQDEKEKWLAYDQVVNVLAPLFEKGQRLYFLDAQIALSRISVYLHAIAETFPDAWGDNKKYRLTAAAGFEVVMGLFERAHERARDLKTSEGPTKDDFKLAIEPIKAVSDWTAETFKERGYTGSAGRKILLKELLSELPAEY